VYVAMKRRYQQSESENRGESRELPREVTFIGDVSRSEVFEVDSTFYCILEAFD